MKRILLIETGGTIAMRISQSNDPIEIDPGRSAYIVRESMPELNKLADISTRNLLSEDSSNLNPHHWVRIAQAIDEHYESFDGFVILHGTDTMAYTASALSFCLTNLNKPVVLTGSQVPLMSIRSDARRNLINAIEVATMPINEVAVCFNDYVFRGNRTTKMSIGDFDAFKSPNFPPLAEIGLQIETRFRGVDSDKSFEVSADFDNSVYLLKLFPGLNPKYLYPLLDWSPRVLIIEAFGCGNIPVSGPYNLLPFIKQFRDKEIPIVIRSQADYDSVDLTKYRSGKELLSLGAIGAGDMTTESAVTKMMYLLAHDDAKADIAERFITPIAGEITQK